MTSNNSKSCKPASSFRSTSLCEPVKIQVGDGENQPTTVPQLFEKIVKNYGDRPALKAQGPDKKWITQTYQEYWKNTRQIARGFIKLGLEPRSSCGILAFNSPEWFLTQMATIFAGGVSAGIYLSNSPEAVYHVLHTSNATICVVDNMTQMAKIRSVRHRLPHLKAVVQIEAPYDEFIDSEDGYYSWSQVKALGNIDSEHLEEQLQKRMDDIVPNECVTLIFTSGTVGMPKGVMLSHDNFITAANIFIDNMPNVIIGEEVMVSYLPMNHVAGQLIDFFVILSMASCVYFADRNALKDTLLETVAEAQPTRFFGVPRVFEKMHDKLVAEEQNLSWISRLVLHKAREKVLHYNLSLMEDTNPTGYLGYWFGLRITAKLIASLGFGRCKTFFTGAAPSAWGMKKFLSSYGINLTELYGLSETTGPVTACWNLENLHSCGRALPGVEVRLENTDENGHGEVCARGRVVFMGYLQEPEKTKKTFSDDGWMHTGDIGYFDNKGFLYISSRLKELIVTSGGENIPPSYIELLVLHELPGLSNAILIGDSRKFLSILVTIKTDIDLNSGKPGDNLQPESLEWMKSLGLPYVKLTQILEAGPCPKVLQSIQEGIDRANSNAISNAQRVQKFAILPHDFSIPTGELGPTLKLRRNIVFEKYADVIENFYKNT